MIWAAEVAEVAHADCPDHDCPLASCSKCSAAEAALAQTAALKDRAAGLTHFGEAQRQWAQFFAAFTPQSQLMHAERRSPQFVSVLAAYKRTVVAGGRYADTLPVGAEVDDELGFAMFVAFHRLISFHAMEGCKRCALCWRKCDKLIHSHIISNAMLTLLLDGMMKAERDRFVTNFGDPAHEPSLTTGGVSTLTWKMLCASCETIMAVRGEDPCLEQLARPLLATQGRDAVALSQAQPWLSFFASSLMWRVMLAIGTTMVNANLRRLYPQQQRLRRYLLQPAAGGLLTPPPIHLLSDPPPMFSLRGVGLRISGELSTGAWPMFENQADCEPEWLYVSARWSVLQWVLPISMTPVVPPGMALTFTADTNCVQTAPAVFTVPAREERTRHLYHIWSCQRAAQDDHVVAMLAQCTREERERLVISMGGFLQPPHLPNIAHFHSPTDHPPSVAPMLQEATTVAKQQGRRFFIVAEVKVLLSTEVQTFGTISVRRSFDATHALFGDELVLVADVLFHATTGAVDEFIGNNPRAQQLIRSWLQEDAVGQDVSLAISKMYLTAITRMQGAPVTRGEVYGFGAPGTNDAAAALQTSMAEDEQRKRLEFQAHVQQNLSAATAAETKRTKRREQRRRKKGHKLTTSSGSSSSMAAPDPEASSPLAPTWPSPVYTASLRAQGGVMSETAPGVSFTCVSQTPPWPVDAQMAQQRVDIQSEDGQTVMAEIEILLAGTIDARMEFGRIYIRRVYAAHEQSLWGREMRIMADVRFDVQSGAVAAILGVDDGARQMIQSWLQETAVGRLAMQQAIPALYAAAVAQWREASLRTSQHRTKQLRK